MHETLCKCVSAAITGEGQPGCSTWLVHATKRGIYKVHSTCPLRQVPSSYGAAAKYSVNSPCTNMVLKCPECQGEGPETYIWKYNMAAHLKLAHSEAACAKWAADVSSVISEQEIAGVLKRGGMS